VVIMPNIADRHLAAGESDFEIRSAGEGDIVAGRDGLAAGVVEALRDAGHSSGAIGVVGLDSIVPVGAYRVWEQELPTASFTDATNVLATIKAVKSPAELHEVEVAMAAADAGVALVAKRLRPGVTGWELRSEIEREIRLRGARFSLIFASARPFFIAPPTDRPFQEGDLVTAYVELTSATGYWVELARLYALGNIDSEAQQLAEACLRGADLAEAALAAGRPVADVATALDGEAASIGAVSGIWHGHGVGVDHDVPVITAQSTERFEAGSVISIHPNFHSRSGRFGASVADTYVLTAEGTRRVSTIPRELERLE
jgi:Xaa-Pro aminopeptidase